MLINDRMLDDGDPILMMGLNHQKDDTHQSWKVVGPLVTILRHTQIFAGVGMLQLTCGRTTYNPILPNHSNPFGCWWKRVYQMNAMQDLIPNSRPPYLNPNMNCFTPISTLWTVSPLFKPQPQEVSFSHLNLARWITSGTPTAKRSRRYAPSKICIGCSRVCPSKRRASARPRAPGVLDPSAPWGAPDGTDGTMGWDHNWPLTLASKFMERHGKKEKVKVKRLNMIWNDLKWFEMIWNDLKWLKD